MNVPVYPYATSGAVRERPVANVFCGMVNDREIRSLRQYPRFDGFSCERKNPSYAANKFEGRRQRRVRNQAIPFKLVFLICIPYIKSRPLHFETGTRQMMKIPGGGYV